MQTVKSNPRTRNPKPHQIAYRYIPGAFGTHCAIDNGAVMTQEFRQRASLERRLARLVADPRVQWAKAL